MDDRIHQTQKSCPVCGYKLEKVLGVYFSKPLGLTIKEFEEAKLKQTRFDCVVCKRAWLFFPKRIYYWQRPENKGWRLKEWRIA